MASVKLMQAFNAHTQQVEDHKVTIDRNGDYLFTANDGSFFKLPGSLTPSEVPAALAEYQSANEGQVAHDTDISDAEAEAKLAALDEVGATDAPTDAPVGGVEALTPNPAEGQLASDTIPANL